MKIKEKSLASQAQNQEIIISNEQLIQFVKHGTGISNDLLNLLVRYATVYNNVYVSQWLIAQKIGCSREWANKIIKRLHLLGLIQTVNRGFKEKNKNYTNLYRLHPAFADLPTRKQLEPYLPVCKWLPLSLLNPSERFKRAMVVFSALFSWGMELGSRSIEFTHIPYRELKAYELLINTPQKVYTSWQEALQEQELLLARGEETSKPGAGGVDEPHLGKESPLELALELEPSHGKCDAMGDSDLVFYKEPGRPELDQTKPDRPHRPRAFKKEEAMNVFKQTGTEPVFYIEQISEMKLTLAGKIKLSAFPEPAIRFARERLEKVRPASPFGFFLGCCRKWCEEHAIRPDWQWVDKRLAALSISLDADCLIDKSLSFSHKREGENQLPKNKPLSTTEKMQQERAERARDTDRPYDWVYPEYEADKDPYDKMGEFYLTPEASKLRIKDREAQALAKAKGLRVQERPLYKEKYNPLEIARELEIFEYGIHNMAKAMGIHKAQEMGYGLMRSFLAYVDNGHGDYSCLMEEVIDSCIKDAMIKIEEWRAKIYT